MKIEKIRLRNFRNFAEAEFSFPAMFTVVIGENGKGKSSLLGALRIGMSGLPSCFKEVEDDSFVDIHNEDVRCISLSNRFAPQYPAEVHTIAKLGDRNEIGSWNSDRNSSISSGFGGSGALIPFTSRLEHLTNEELLEVDFPVLLYFGTSRLWQERRKATDLKTKGSKIFDGYVNCLNPKHDSFTALSWIKSHDIKNLRAQVEGKPGDVLLEAVLEAISTCVPDWTNLRWDEDSDDLGGDFADEGLRPLRYLSDGLRTMAGMAAEIAYRCVTLNGHHGREAVKQSRGVVLIDELDMHLHPNWQRRVVGDLKRAFPNLQFVATTHSPFIVQSLDSNELINLDEPNELRPKDLPLEDVAEKIMGVESPFGVENQQKEALSGQYLKLLEAPKSQQREASLNALEAKVSDPMLRAMMRMERLAKMGDES